MIVMKFGGASVESAAIEQTTCKQVAIAAIRGAAGAAVLNTGMMHSEGMLH